MPNTPNIPATFWRSLAACLTTDPDTFFDDTNTTAANAVCATCPVIAECLAAALAEEEGKGKAHRSGVRGGQTSRQRWTSDRKAAREQPAALVRPLQPCGTSAAYNRHVNQGEPPCDPCRDAATADKRARRAQKRGPAECGTTRGYRAHRARKEDACRPCKDANADADRRLRNTGTSLPLATV